jgi:deoxyinosine 3'endonuclease (endonuclease V)
MATHDHDAARESLATTGDVISMDRSTDDHHMRICETVISMDRSTDYHMRMHESKGEGKRPFDLEAQRQAWIQEQLDVASQVVVLLDPVPQQLQLQLQECYRFQPIPLHAIYALPNHFYGGVDVSFPTNEKDPAVAVYVIIDAQTEKIVYQDYQYFDLQVPYIPSFLAFREIEPLQRLVEKQKQQRPDLQPAAILVDGNGILHPRRAGLACFLGVRTGIPTIGVGKTLFCEGGLSKEVVMHTVHESLLAAVAHVQSIDPKEEESGVVLVDGKGTNPAPKTPFNISDEKTKAHDGTIDRGTLLRQLGPFCQGVAIPLVANDYQRGGQATLACALVGHGGRIRIRGGKSTRKPTVGSNNPIFVSVGHAISLYEAVQICASLSLARTPEPIRQADLLGRSLLRLRL